MSGAFVLSVDVEGLWGLFFVRSYVDDPSAAQAGRRALPSMGAVLSERGMRGTFAFVGHLLLRSCGPWAEAAHPEMPRAQYPWYDREWYADDPGADEDTAPLWYAASQALEIRAGGHEVAAHGFAHAILDESCVPADVAAAEYRAAQEAAAGLGLPVLRSYVYPQNVVGHVDGLAAAGFDCYRESDGGRPARPGPPGGLGRAMNLARHAVAAAPFVGRARVRDDGVVALPSSFPLLGREGLRRVVGRPARLARVEKGLAEAARTGGVLHLWTHPHAFPDAESFGDLEATLDLVARWRDRGDVEVLSMAELADRARSDAGSGGARGGA